MAGLSDVFQKVTFRINAWVETASALAIQIHDQRDPGSVAAGERADHDRAGAEVVSHIATADADLADARSLVQDRQSIAERTPGGDVDAQRRRRRNRRCPRRRR